MLLPQNYSTCLKCAFFYQGQWWSGGGDTSFKVKIYVAWGCSVVWTVGYNGSIRPSMQRLWNFPDLRFMGR